MDVSQFSPYISHLSKLAYSFHKLNELKYSMIMPYVSYSNANEMTYTYIQIPSFVTIKVAAWILLNIFGKPIQCTGMQHEVMLITPLCIYKVVK